MWQLNLKCSTERSIDANGIQCQLKYNECLWLLWLVHNIQNTFKAMAISNVHGNRSKRSEAFIEIRERKINQISLHFFLSHIDDSRSILIFHAASPNRLSLLIILEFDEFFAIILKKVILCRSLRKNWEFNGKYDDFQVGPDISRTSLYFFFHIEVFWKLIHQSRTCIPSKDLCKGSNFPL